MIWQCSSTLQVGLGLLSVLSKSAVDLLVEVSISVVDEVHVLVCVVLASATVRAALVLPVKTESHQATKNCQAICPFSSVQICSICHLCIASLQVRSVLVSLLC